MDNFEWNKVAAGGLLAGIVILGTIIVSGEVFKVKAPEKRAYAIEGVEVEASDAGAASAAPAGPPLPVLLASASAEKGANVFKKCATCHTIEKGGPAKTGPNLWGILGNHHAHAPGFGYSAAITAKAGETWTWEAANHWVENPREAIPGNKMSFAGLSKPEERANLLVYLNQNSDKPLPLPKVEAAPSSEAKAEAAEAKPGAVPAESKPAEAAAAK